MLPVKSPIKHPLDHARCLSHLKSIIPEQSVVWSYLFFSGQLEFSLAKSGRFVCAHTDKMPIYEFWNCLVADPEEVYNVVTSKQFQSLKDEQLFYMLQESWPYHKNPTIRAASFFFLNRCSNIGNVSSGEYNGQGLTPMAMSYLKRFKAINFYLRYADDFNKMTMPDISQESDFLLFPMKKYSHNLFEYGQSLGPEESAVNHNDFFEKISRITEKWIVLYKRHPMVFEIYKNFNIQMINKFGAPTANMADCEDIVVTNF
jgi:site-specific DNA-adenine methylase